jgi:hypothetical protein
MTTGYTHDVADGKLTDFRTFALQCARAFGATIMQRDEALDVPPRPQKVDEYYERSVREAKQELARYNTMSLTTAEQEARLEYERLLATQAEYKAEKDVKRARYEAMLAEVLAWEPPTKDHRELKKFMEEQLRESIRFDCGEWLGPSPTRKKARAWLDEKRELALRRVNSAQESLADERERAEQANAWIAALYDSLATQTT